MEAVRLQLAQLWVSATTGSAAAGDGELGPGAGAGTSGHGPSGRGAAGGGRGRGRGGRGGAAASATVIATSAGTKPRASGLRCGLALGVEYQCGRGCRFLLQQWPPRAGGHNGKPTASSAQQLLGSDLPLFLTCPHCPADDDDADDAATESAQARRPTSLAQLTRLFIRTPDAPFSVSSRPVVHFHGPPPPAPTPPTLPSSAPQPTAPVAAPTPLIPAPADPTDTPPPQLLSFAPSEVVELPPGSLVALRLPLAYGLPASGGGAERPLVQASPGWPFRAWLRKGTALFPTPPKPVPAANAPPP